MTSLKAQGSRLKADTSTALSLQPSAFSAVRLGACWRTAAVAAVVALAPVVWPSEAQGFGFSVEPARVQISVPAGKRRGQTLTVRNDRPDEAIHFTVYVRDVIHLPDGTHDYPPPGSTEWSGASWIQVVPTELEVPAGGSRDVRVSVLAPPDAAGGHYAVVFFEAGPSYAGQEGISVNFRVGAIVEAVVRGTERVAAQLQDVAFSEPSAIRAEVFNGGNVLIRPAGSVRVFGVDGQKVRQVPFNPSLLGVLPRTLRSISSPIAEPLPPGRYRARVELDYGASTLLVGEHAFVVP